MAFRLPSFADVGFDDPRAAGGKPNFPASDPGAEGLAVLGKGAQAAGNALREYSEDAALKNDKLNESNATLDLFTRLSPLQTKIDLETDTDKIAEHRAEINSLLQTSGNALAGNRARQKAWMASHVKTILEANSHADKRTTLLYRNKSNAASGVLLDRVTREGVESDDPQAFSIALQGIDTNLEYQGANGDKLPVAIEEERKRRRKELVEGRVLHLTSKGKLVEAQALLDTQGHLIADSIQRERFGARIAEKAEKFGDDAELNRRWGGSDKGYAGNRGGGGMQVGGAISSAIADEAGRQSVDQKTALATAQIESSMGSNLGSRGNIFQLGKSEWAAIGGGSMGEPGTDIKNGVAWLGRVKSELADRLGREPEGWEIYLGHQQGVAGATKLLGSPNTPAGQLLPPEHIKANGGDPNAPASAFIGKWRNKFNRAADGIGSGPVVAGAGVAETPRDLGLSDAKPVAIGDSIAAHLIRKAGVGGTEYNDVYKDDSTAVSGHGPAAVLGTIRKTPEANIKGRDVLLSTGVSNDPTQIDMVADQIKSLKARGARSVTVLGVGTAERVKGANDALSQIAADSGAAFAGPMRKVAGDGIHSSDPKDLLAQAQAVRPAVAARGKGPDRLEADQNDAPASGEPIPLDSPGAPAVAPSVAALPDIDTMIAEVQADADSGAITQKRANFVMAGLRGRYNRIHAAQANDRAALTKRLTNGLAALEDGREFEVDPALVRHHFPKEKADEILLAFQDTKEAGQITAGVRTSSLEDLDRQQQQITAGLADQNAPDYVRRRKLANAFGAAVEKRSKELSKDPAAYVAMYSPPVAEKYAAATDPAQPPETAAQRFSDYATAALAEQGRLGLPEESRAVLPKGVATAAAEKIAAIDPAKQNPGTALAALARSYGAGTANDHWPQVFGELVKAKLPGTYQVLATMDRPDQVVAAGDLSRAIVVASEKGGMSVLKKNLGDEKLKDIDNELTRTLADFHESVRPQSDGQKLYSNVFDAAQALAGYYVFQGKSAANAAAAAVDGIINAKYDFGKVGANQVRVPKGTLGVVERAADVVKAGITVDQLGPIPGNQLVPPEKRAETWLGAIRAGGWANNENDSGLVLMGRFHNNRYHAIRRADGSRIEVKFDAAAALAASAGPTPQVNFDPSGAGTDAGRLSEDFR